MNLCFMANNLLMLAGGSIDGASRPSTDEYVGVTLGGLGIVILALALLVFVIFCFGKLFDALDGAKQRREAKAAADKAPKPSSEKPAPVKAAPAPAPAPAPVAAAAEDDDEVIAVISAVVAMMSEADGTTYRVKSVNPVQQSGFGGRSAWAMDGRRSNVSPF